MSGAVWTAGISAAGAVALLLGPVAGSRAPGPTPPARGASLATIQSDPGWMRRWRVLLALSAAIGALTLLGGLAGALAAPVAAVVTGAAIERIEPAGLRRAREQVARELPHLVRLLGVALSSGAPPASALEIVGEALPGPASDRLRPVAVRLRLGADPAAAWAALASDPELAPLGRTLSLAEDGGLSVAAAIARLADDLAQRERAGVERKARAVGVKAAVPLGLCLLPAFLLIGIVPLVGGLITTIDW